MELAVDHRVTREGGGFVQGAPHELGEAIGVAFDSELAFDPGVGVVHEPLSSAPEPATSD